MSVLPPKNLLSGDGEALNHGTIFAGDADQLFVRLQEEIPWQHDVVKMFGKTITTARKVAWYGDKELAYTYSGMTKEPLAWTGLLTKLKEQVESETRETFNSCLLNLYHDGSEGMSWHRDNESSMRKHSPIACLTFGAVRRFHFKHLASKERITTMLEHGSLLVMAGEIQTHWMHCLPKMVGVKNPRVSLTFRQMETLGDEA